MMIVITTSSRLTALFILLGLAEVVFACAGPGHHALRLNPGGRTVRAGRRRDNSNPCAGYDYPPTAGLAARYPSPTEIATLVPSDTAALSLFNTIDARVRSALPNDLPKGQPNGNFTGVAYNGGTDPDCWWSYTGCDSPATATGIARDITTVPEPGSYGLTYDDGPNCENAPLYDWLAQNNVKATLFYIGGNVLNWPLQAIAGHEGGHQICVHTWSHHYMTALSNEQVFAELYYTQRIIKDVLGVMPQCWRPPYGDVDNRVRMIAAGMNLTTILWSEDSADWTLDSGAPVSSIDANYQAVINKQKNGTYSTFGPVVRSHELTNLTINEALKFLPTLKSTFSHLIPIATAYNITHPYVEQNVSYPTFAQYITGDTNTTITSVSASVTSASTTPGSSSSSVGSSSASASIGTSNHNVQATSAGLRTITTRGPILGLALCILAASL